MAKVKVAINGFGRIGRVFLRAAYQDLDIVAINDTADLATSAHLLEYDSAHGKSDFSVSFADGHLLVGEKKMRYFQERDPLKLPWGDLGVDVVVECTGAFKKKEDFLKHIQSGAKKVLVSAPAEGVDLTVVYGVNHQTYDAKNHQVVSNASCTTNCLAPVAKVIHEEFGIRSGMMTTIHSYTNDQRILDGTHKDLRRARTAAVSMIPTTTGAAKAVGQVLPALKGKIDGTSIRVPTPNVSLVDFTFNSEKEISVSAINEALIKASEGALKGVLGVEKKELVSIDFNGNPLSSIVDLASTMQVGNNLGKIFSWYDNETGFSVRMKDFVLYMNEKGL